MNKPKPMISVHACNLLYEDSDSGRAKVVWNLFTALLENAIRRQMKCECELAGYQTANDTYNHQVKNSGGIVQGRPPFSPHIVRQKKEEIASVKQSCNEIKAMLRFLRDRWVLPELKHEKIAKAVSLTC